MYEKTYTLMNKDKEVAEIGLKKEYGTEEFRMIKQFDSYLPRGFSDINAWIEGRQIAKHRKQIKELMIECGINTKSGFLSMTRALTLTDTFWVRESGSGEEWNSVSLYQNKFDEVIARIAFDGVGLYGKEFRSTTPELSTDGSFEKCWIREDDDIFLIKRGSYGFANAGMEPFSEKLTSDLLGALDYNHVRYDLVNHREKLASKCALFTSEQYGFLNAATYFGRKCSLPEIARGMQAIHFKDEFDKMLIVDALTANVDRHMGNFGFIVDNESGEIVNLAPLFDHNMAILPYLMENDNLEDYLKMQGPKLGDDFVETANSVINENSKSDIANLRQFSYSDPGFDFPKWKLDRDNELLSRQVDRILGKSRVYFRENNVPDENKYDPQFDQER